MCVGYKAQNHLVVFTSHKRFGHEVTPRRIGQVDGDREASAWSTLTPAGVRVHLKNNIASRKEKKKLMVMDLTHVLIEEKKEETLHCTFFFILANKRHTIL